jgi:hypothetical protein
MHIAAGCAHSQDASGLGRDRQAKPAFMKQEPTEETMLEVTVAR